MTVLETVRRDIEKRLADIEHLLAEAVKPLQAEKERLERALAALHAGAGGAATRREKGRGKRAPARPSKGQAAEKTSRRRKTKGDRFIELVAKEPGITNSEAARKLKVAPSYISKLANQGVAAGRLRKKGRGFYPAGAKANRQQAPKS